MVFIKHEYNHYGSLSNRSLFNACDNDKETQQKNLLKSIAPFLAALIVMFGIFPIDRISSSSALLTSLFAEKDTVIDNKRKCRELARSLSNNYRSSLTYNSSLTSLSKYLNNTGILLTMCVGNEMCGPSSSEDHLAASWIQDSTTGLRTMDILGSLGLVLDPITTMIDCMYPVDASTDRRDQKGCGAFLSKKKTPGEQTMTRKRIENYKQSIYGYKKPWEDIPCAGFLDNLFKFVNNNSLGMIPSNLTFVNGPCNNNTAWNNETNNLSYTSGLVVAKHFFEMTMGHAICTLTRSDTIPSFDLNFPFIYNGNCSWEADQWQSVIGSIQYLIREYPSMKVWNEIVIRKSTKNFNLNELVTAVFYTNESSKMQAQTEASQLGGKPVLEMLTPNGNKNADLFRCGL